MSKYPLDLVQQYYPGAIMFEAQKYWSMSEDQKKKYNVAEVVDNGKYFGQLKKDGNWYAFVKGIGGQKYLFSRNESKKTGLLTERIENVPHIEKALDCLPNGTVLIGEIYVPGGDSNATRQVMGCLPAKAIERQKEDGYVHYYIFDCVAYDGKTFFDSGSWQRWLKTKEIYEKHDLINKVEGKQNFLELAETFTDNLYQRAMTYLENGEEGMVIKKLDSPYTPGKKPAWSSIKLKKEDSADLVCMGYEQPTKEYDGKEIDTWDYWLIEQYNAETDSWEEHRRIRHHIAIDEDDMRIVAITKPYYFGWAGSMRIGAYDKDNKLVEVGTVSSGLTDEVRASLAKDTDSWIGKVVKIDMMEKFEGTIRQPIYRGLHADKNAYECTIEDIFNK